MNRLEIPWLQPGFVVIYAIVFLKTDFDGRVKFLLKIMRFLVGKKIISPKLNFSSSVRC